MKKCYHKSMNSVLWKHRERTSSSPWGSKEPNLRRKKKKQYLTWTLKDGGRKKGKDIPAKGTAYSNLPEV